MSFNVPASLPRSVPQALPPPLAARPDTGRPSVVIVSPGEIDVATAPALAERLAAIEADADVVIDVRDLRFCDSSAITVLLAAQRRITDHGGTLTLHGPPPAFNRLLELCGLDGHFAVMPATDPDR